MLPIQTLRKMPELTHHQWKLIFTAVRKYQFNYPEYVSCYTEMRKDLSEILDILEPYAYTETYLDHEHQTADS
jgi:hypothetical protein